ncbi:ROK family transcriptional regulator, partial [Nakamurella lactea]|uniref:ROK family transcriptional regulator n=1 Tax=Nakamurella lactea TaxID=459515 RepID=UPI00041157A2
MSRRLVLEELIRSAPISQADVVRRTGLSRATVASVVTELTAEGRLVTVDGPAPNGRGRPPRLLQPHAGSGVVAGLDLGHSHLAIAVADLTGTLLAETRTPMNIDASADAAIDTAVTSLQKMLGELAAGGELGAPKSIVIGVPGPIDSTTGQLRSGTVLSGWVGVQPAEEFSRRLGQPVVLENDANLGAIGEYTYGRGRGIDNLLYVKVSSGIGAGMILNGELYRGSRGTAGEIGHVQVSEDGPLCRCGSRGCLETQSSAEAALALLRQTHGPQMTLEDAIAIVRAGDPGAVRLFTDMGTAIGRVVAAVSANLDPQLVVVGGPMVDDPGPLLAGITAAVRRYTQPYVSSQLVVAGGQLHQRAGLLGAVAMATQLATAP